MATAVAEHGSTSKAPTASPLVAKAMVHWTWAGVTHERPGRITVRTDEADDG